MIREIVHIDEELCNGCGDCVPNCHEGALQIIDGKARLISDLMCDGLGACIGHCPLDAITIEKREAEPYDEMKVMAIMVEKGKNTVRAHLKHLLDHNETEFYNEAMEYLVDHEGELTFKLNEVGDLKKTAPVNHDPAVVLSSEPLACGCPGSAEKSFQSAGMVAPPEDSLLADAPSQLSQWPVQMHLINPAASFFKGTDVVLAADCVAYALGNFHQKYLKGKSLAIACPKLDQGPEIYIEKIRRLIDESKINTLHLMIMEVPCCGGLRQMVELAHNRAERKVPVKQTVVSAEGAIVSEEWV
ncbi:MAG: 4Fe-4S dicluster domain-containing protein [Bacteroidales bacterium]